MTSGRANGSGRVVAIWRYPVKSMLGEELNAVDVHGRGLLGDRGYALIDEATGRVASAKNPRTWPNLFEFRAAYLDAPSDPASLPPARITFPDGSRGDTDQPDIARRLSEAVGRPVRLASTPPEAARIEGYWPDHDFLSDPDTTFHVDLPPGTFFDGSVLHLVTTATLDRLRALAPAGRFEVSRFRPNLVVEAPAGAEGFVENDWLEKTLAIGDEVQLRVTTPCPRCVMTTLPQGDLPKEPGILRAAVEHNGGNVGVNAAVLRGGRIRRGDAVRVE